MGIEEKLEKAEREAEEKRLAMYAVPAEEEVVVEGEATDMPETTEELQVEDKKVVAEGVAETVELTSAEEDKKAEEIPSSKNDEEETYKKRFQIMEGKYKAEVPRLSAELGQWKEYATNLQERVTVLENLSKEKSETAVESLDEEDDPDLEIFVNDYPGAAKLIKNMKVAHKAEIEALKLEMGNVVSKDIGEVKKDIQATKFDRFDMAIREAGVPNWKEIDIDPDFHLWLAEVVPYTRNTRLEFLQQAAKDLDAVVAAKFFLDYKASKGNGNEEIEQEDKQNKLEKFTAPPRSTGRGTPLKTAAHPGLTREQYVKFMNPHYKFNSADWGGRTEVQMEALFNSAIAKNELL